MRRCELREISFEQALQHLLSQRSEVAKQLQAPIITQHQVYLPLRYRVVMGGIVRGECPSKIDRGKCPGGNCPGGMSGGEVSRGENVRFPPRRAISTCWEVAEMEFGLYGADWHNITANYMTFLRQVHIYKVNSHAALTSHPAPQSPTSNHLRRRRCV